MQDIKTIKLSEVSKDSKSSDFFNKKLKTYPDLQELDCSNVDVGDDAMPDLITSLLNKENPEVRKLNLANCFLWEDDGITKLLETEKIASLNIRHNFLHPKKLKTIEASILKNENLIEYMGPTTEKIEKHLKQQQLKARAISTKIANGGKLLNPKDKDLLVSMKSSILYCLENKMPRNKAKAIYQKELQRENPVIIRMYTQLREALALRTG